MAILDSKQAFPQAALLAMLGGNAIYRVVSAMAYDRIQVPGQPVAALSFIERATEPKQKCGVACEAGALGLMVPLPTL